MKLENSFMNEKYVLISSQNVSENSVITRNIQPVDTANVKRSGVKHWLMLSDCSDILHFKCAGTDSLNDGHGESNSCISQFWNVIRNKT